MDDDTPTHLEYITGTIPLEEVQLNLDFLSGCDCEGDCSVSYCIVVDCSVSCSFYESETNIRQMLVQSMVSGIY